MTDKVYKKSSLVHTNEQFEKYLRDYYTTF